jgi:hypothetical protein
VILIRQGAVRAKNDFKVAQQSNIAAAFEKLTERKMNHLPGAVYRLVL